MQPVLTPSEMGEADRRTIAAGTAEAVLVARAGAAVARVAVEMLGGTYGRRVVVVGGKGNNGADARVAADRLRARGMGVDEFALVDGIDRVVLARACARADLAIDGMFGTGFRGALADDAALVAANFASLPTLAIDIPSGVDGATGEVRGPAVRADVTVTFAALKPGLLFEPGRAHAGDVRVVDIGIDVARAAAHLHVLDRDDLVLPHRGTESHKWSAGVFVVGGSTGMTGAPIMTSHAAARSGAGMVVCGLPGAEAAARTSASEIVTRALPATAEGYLDRTAAAVVCKDADRFDAIALGPGLGRDERTQAAITEIVAECATPLVVDADALNAIAVDLAPLRSRHAAGLPPAILTPHAGEYARLAGSPVGADRVAAARSLADRTESIVVLKGPGTVVAVPGGDAIVNRTDTAALATAGTGDVLTGIIAGLLAAGAEPFAAAATAAFVHGCAARVAGTGDALVANDLISALPPTLTALRSGRHPWEE